MLGAYETDPGLPHRRRAGDGAVHAVASSAAAFQERVARARRLTRSPSRARVEPLFERACAVVAMGGYNTFCEILSFGKPALLVPRTEPRLEQYLRAERAAELGLVRDAAPTTALRPGGAMAARLARRCRALPVPAVAELRAPMLDGLDRIAAADRAAGSRAASA